MASTAETSVIVVEDHDAVRRSLTLMLRTRGARVDAYRSGTELLASGQLPQDGCFLIDYRMPGVNGLDLLARLREKGCRQPAFLLTGDPDPCLKARARVEGFTALIEKPAEAEELIELVTRASGLIL
ncbi:MAG: response regulator, partial [Pseudomonadota bacterium]